MIKTLDDPFYYLANFHRVIDWSSERYDSLLNTDERMLIGQFNGLVQPSRALLVRMVMRKGNLFRASKLQYDEIGCPREAVLALVAYGWVDDRPLLTLDQLFDLLTKAEIAEAFRSSLRGSNAKKAEQLDMLRAEFADERPLDAWHPNSNDCVYQVRIDTLCDRLRLMFFGNLYQDWSEFVLSDLGIYRYEKVAFSPESQGFRTRDDVDMYLHLHQCRERFEQGEELDLILKDIPSAALTNTWLESRRAKLLFAMAQHCERAGALQQALDIYAGCSFPGARIRTARVLERCEQFESALALAKAAELAPESETEKQQLMRILPRLHRKLGLPKMTVPAAVNIERIDLVMPQPDTSYSVELLVADHFAECDAPVFYVENTLITSLFGLMCWQAIFTAVPGAFFHPFHIGPADLHSADFHRRREQEFAACLSQLDSTQYIETINRTYADKMGIQSPFVVWPVLTEELKDLALACIPAAHLKKWFERILLDIQSNRAGFPDLIQFWPKEKRYRMIEVKGPGDRLQDNQIRWLDYFIAHQMPVSVCYVQWSEDGR